MGNLFGLAGTVISAPNGASLNTLSDGQPLRTQVTVTYETVVEVSIPSLMGNLFGQLKNQSEIGGQRVSIPSLMGNLFGPCHLRPTDYSLMVSIPSLMGNLFGLGEADRDTLCRHGLNTLSDGQPLRTPQATRCPREGIESQYPL